VPNAWPCHWDSAAFRRLGGVTQVVAVSETLLVHNRLTHTLKVAQIARRLAQKILDEVPVGRVKAAGGINPDVVETAALAHDLGHPPFGHVAEVELQRILQEDVKLADGFEGNAQSFRIVTKLAIRSVETICPALNLTRASLRAVLKYPWMRGHSPTPELSNKWAAYDTEEEDYHWAMEGGAQPPRPSVEARIMDWADDIAYAVHDVQDYYRAGLIPLDRLRASKREGSEFIDAAADWLETKGFNRKKCQLAFAALQKALPYDPYTGSLVDRATMHSFASGLITTFLSRVEILANGEFYEHEEHRYMLEVLKQLTWHYVINRPPLATLQRGERHVVETLYSALTEWAALARKDRREDQRLPQQFRELLTLVRGDAEAVRIKKGADDQLMARATVDYLSSLTEAQAIKLYQRLLGGHVEGSALEVWLRV
jgi:dGTPase